MELKQVGEKTYYIENNTNIGIYLLDDKHIFLIDTGNDKEAGKKILKIVTEKGWEVVGIISTHSNADHVGGNKLIQERTNCKIYSYGIETVIEYPKLIIRKKQEIIKFLQNFALPFKNIIPESMMYKIDYKDIVEM